MSVWDSGVCWRTIHLIILFFLQGCMWYIMVCIGIMAILIKRLMWEMSAVVIRAHDPVIFQHQYHSLTLSLDSKHNHDQDCSLFIICCRYINSVLRNRCCKDSYLVRNLPRHYLRWYPSTTHHPRQNVFLRSRQRQHTISSNCGQASFVVYHDDDNPSFASILSSTVL